MLETSPEISVWGKLLREMLATKNWVLVNGQGKEIVEGGEDLTLGRTQHQGNYHAWT